MGEEAEIGDGVDTKKADEAYEFPVVQEGDLPLHFADGFFDGHKVEFYVIKGNNNGYWRILHLLVHSVKRIVTGYGKIFGKTLNINDLKISCLCRLRISNQWLPILREIGNNSYFVSVNPY